MKVGEDGPKDAASHGEGERETVVNPVHCGIAGFTGVPMGCDAGEMKEVLSGELGEMIEGPVQLVLNPAADDWEGIQEGSIRADQNEAKEVEKSDAEAKASNGAPGREWTSDGDGNVRRVQGDLACRRFWLLDDCDRGRVWSRGKKILVRRWQARSLLHQARHSFEDVETITREAQLVT